MAAPKKSTGATRGEHRPNKSEASVFASQIVESPEYRESLLRRIASDRLAPAVEVLLLHYRYGKPVERKEHAFPEGIPNYSGLSASELAERAAELSRQIAEAREAMTKIELNEKFPTSFDPNDKVM